MMAPVVFTVTKNLGRLDIVSENPEYRDMNRRMVPESELFLFMTMITEYFNNIKSETVVFEVKE